MIICRILVIFMDILTTSMVMGLLRITLNRGRVLLLYQVMTIFPSFFLKVYNLKKDNNNHLLVYPKNLTKDQ